MKLFVNSGSPFARKARIVVRERGWAPGVEEVFTVPVESPDDLVGANPVAQIPALIGDDGVCWQDSTLICAWLDAKGEGAPLLPPADSAAYWAVRRLEAAAVALIEMNVRMVLENRRLKAAAGKRDDIEVRLPGRTAVMVDLRYRLRAIGASTKRRGR